MKKRNRKLVPAFDWCLRLVALHKNFQIELIIFCCSESSERRVLLGVDVLAILPAHKKGCIISAYIIKRRSRISSGIRLEFSFLIINNKCNRLTWTEEETIDFREKLSCRKDGVSPQGELTSVPSF